MSSEPHKDIHLMDRQPHAVLDYDSRVQKAKKIVALVGAERFRTARRILEIGCGSGVISSSLARLSSAEVHAIDVVDNRMTTDGYQFQLVQGTKLPFDDDSFEIVITNHVIEHVGDEQAQLTHLSEIRRVLADSGVVYLAVPNKWRLIEPHFRLPLLSWLPQWGADLYVRLSGRGKYYDCLPLSHGQAIRYFETTGFAAKDMTVTALRETLSIEFPQSRVVRFVEAIVPDWAIKAAMAIMPTYIFLLRRRA